MIMLIIKTEVVSSVTVGGRWTDHADIVSIEVINHALQESTVISTFSKAIAVFNVNNGERFSAEIPVAYIAN